MNIQHEIFHPTWYRFSAYEIRDGYICPEHNAKPKPYEPGEAYSSETDDDRKRLIPPYQSLFDLLHVLAGNRVSSLTSDHHSAIIKWCNKHGPLGLLLHQAYAVFLAPRFEGRPQDLYRPCVAVQRCYNRAGGEWMSIPNSLGPSLSSPLPIELAGQLVGAQTAKSFRNPGVLFEHLGKFRQNWEPLSVNWKRFFPNVPSEEAETYQYPSPASPLFWREYAEPLGDFLQAARLLLSALKDHNEDGPRGLQTLRRLINPIGITFEQSKDHKVEMRWTSPSLLASYAMMILLDFNSDWRLLKCKRCDRLFMSRAYQAAYCSSRCQHTVIKREYRKRLKEKKTQAFKKRVTDER